MPYTIIRQRVGNFARWRRAFEDNAERREEAGSRGGHLFRETGDRDQVVVFLAWTDLEKARAYLASEGVRKEREAGAVVEEPEVLYLEELGRPSR